MVPGLALLLLLLGLAQDKPPTSRDVAEAQSKIAEAISKNDDDALNRRVAADRKFFYKALNGEITRRIFDKADGKNVEFAPLKKAIDAFSKLPDLKEWEKLQVRTTTTRLELGARFSAEEAKQYIDSSRSASLSRQEAQRGRALMAASYMNQWANDMKKMGDPVYEAYALLNAAMVYFQFEAYRESLEPFETAEKRAAEIGDREDEGAAAFGAARALQEHGRYLDAIKKYRHALEIGREVGPELSVVNNLQGLGDSFAAMGSYPEAIEHLEKAVAEARALRERSGEAKALESLGFVVATFDDFQAGIEKLLAALEIYRQTRNRAKEAGCLRILGMAYGTFGEYRTSMESLEKSNRIYASIGDRSGEARTRSDIGVLLGQLGRHEEAAAALEQSARLFRIAGDPEGEAMALTNLGLSCSQLRKFDRAEEALKKALAIAAELKNTGAQIMAWNNLAVAAVMQGHFEEGATALNRVLEALRGTNSQLECVALSSLASCASRQGRDDEAEKYDREALDKLKQGAWSSRLYEMHFQAVLALTLLRRKKLDEADEFARRSIEAAELVRASIGGLQAEKTAWAAQNRYPYEIAAAIKLEKGDASGAFNTLELLRARALLDWVSQTSRASSGVPPDLLARRRDTLGRLNRLRAHLRAAATAIPRSSKEDQESLQKDIQASQKQAAACEDDLKALAHDIEIKQSIEGVRPLPIAEIQKSLRPGEALLTFNVITKHESIGQNTNVETWDRILATILTPEALNVTRIEIPHDYAKDLHWFRTAAAASGRGYPAAEFKKRARRLFDLLIKPIEARLKDVKKLLLAPDGVLYGIPFEALIASETGDKFSEFDYLGARCDIAYVYSGTMLARARAGQPSARQEFVGFGDPDYGTVAKSPSRGWTAPGSIRLEELEAPRDLTDYLKTTGPDEREGWARLPNSGAEVTESIQALHWSGSKEYQKEEASERNAKHVSSARVLHFACHGYYDRDPMKSALVLTSDADNDGYLEAREIADLKIDCDLVVMSACNTASGETLQGEGLIGLTRAWIVAGARRVLASLWAISDEGGKEFMVSFYKRVAAGQDAAAALSETKREFMKSEKYSAPYFWAAFVLYGN